ncbi:biotin-dependent carboxyltransferase family protein [Paenibacillus sp. HB172176]|uniref:5-oxoprolinase subunit C family protein n=1 Tax=Paenibacillus sp. HB172176 TaxID=2493690 RepID=UPI00143B0359|nr:biotin-dependent carboxyltransferase family protein [Paenibacillus sp. HB172176]
MTLTIIKAGMQTTVQDCGRAGYQQYGVVVSGAMDGVAARVGNMLVGNSQGEAVLELTLSGTVLRAEDRLLLAVCGADMAPTANGRELPLWRPVLVEQGTVIAFPVVRSGCRAYIAIAGGFDLPEIMDSRSTYLRGGFGGFEGRALKAGDRLQAKPVNPDSLSGRMLRSFQYGSRFPQWHATHFAVADRGVAAVVRVMAGAHFDRLTGRSKEQLFQSVFRIHVNSDRMGYRLTGEAPLELQHQEELLSEAVANGTIQLPADGNPIVLLADRQTTGGYPRIAQVSTVDLPVFAQLKPGDSVRFVRISYEEAEKRLIESEQDMSVLQSAIALKFPG